MFLGVNQQFPQESLGVNKMSQVIVARRDVLFGRYGEKIASSLFRTAMRRGNPEVNH